MLVLAVETATELAGVALADEDGVRASVGVPRGRRHGESVAPAIAFACERAGVTVRDVEVLAADVGPGLFTGLRVGLATVKAMAFARQLPVVGVTSLEVLATAAAGAVPSYVRGRRIVAIVDARRGQVFAARFTAADEGTVAQVGEDELLDPEALVSRLEEEAAVGPVLCLGDGARRYRALLAAIPGVETAGGVLGAPDPGVLATIALRRSAQGDTTTASALEPRYLRGADVRINWEQRLAVRPTGAS
ncbi:MAG: tRNA (adenosine(37)-N6)-threonylcarbamoyltransferase complex dimerization subunit type 1 TsaB [Acidimicrobiales bacterium]